MKNLEKATEEYLRAKKRAEQMQARAAAAVRKMKECEAAKIEAENMEIVRIIREQSISVPELQKWKKTGKLNMAPVMEESAAVQTESAQVTMNNEMNEAQEGDSNEQNEKENSWQD